MSGAEATSGLRLYGSSRSGEYHLRNVFQKLHITSRNQLDGIPLIRNRP
jgi:DNA-binding CsgD family transcriptional regulator